MSMHPPAANFKEWVDLLGPLINAGATVVIAVATAMYVWLTRKLWVATAKNAELTERMMETSNEPLCSISNVSPTFTTSGGSSRLTVTFQIQNAGRVPVDNVLLVSEWKGADGKSPETTTFAEEWVGVLLPGQNATYKHYVDISRPATKTIERREGRVHFETASVHLALSARFENRAWRPSPRLHIVLAELRLSEGKLRIRQSKIVDCETDKSKVYHLLDDVSATGHGTAPA